MEQEETKTTAAAGVEMPPEAESWVQLHESELTELMQKQAKAAITELKRQEKQERKKEKYHNTFTLMKCYRDMAFHIENAISDGQRLYIITGIWQPPEGRLHGRTTAYILRLLLDQSKPLLLYEFSQVAAYADNPFMGRQYQPVPMQYAGWFRHEIRSIYEQLRAAGVPVREMITEQQRVISW